MSQAPTNPVPVPAPAPAPSPLDRAPVVVPPCTTPQITRYVGPGDFTAAVLASPDHIRWVCSPAEKYLFTGGVLHAKNVSIVLNGSTLQLSRRPGDGCSLNIAGDYFSLLEGTVIGDGSTAIHNTTGKGTNLCDLLVSKVNIFLANDPTGISLTFRRVKQADKCGGQFAYNFADSFLWDCCELPYGSSAEEPLRFSRPDPTLWPGFFAPVGCIARGGFIYQPAGPSNLQKSAFAVRDGSVRICDMRITGAISAGQMSGPDHAAIDVSNVTFDRDAVYANISTQSGVRVDVNKCRFRGGGQPIALGAGSVLRTADGNVIVLPATKQLIARQDGSHADGTNTHRVAA